MRPLKKEVGVKEMSNTNTCERVDDLISFLYGELSELEARKFERHLHECSACKAEFTSFGEIRESIVEWRNESLGLAPLTPVPMAAALAPAQTAKSALAALREFFSLSPMWLKGATAFASILFCICAVLAIGYLKARQPVVASNDKVYSKEEFEARLADALRQRQNAAPAANVRTNDNVAVQTDNRRTAFKPNVISRRSENAGIVQSRNARRPFTKQERQELAADLGLLTSKDDDDLDSVIDSSRPTP